VLLLRKNLSAFSRIVYEILLIEKQYKEIHVINTSLKYIMISSNFSENGKMLMLREANRNLPDKFWEMHLPNEMWDNIFAYVGMHPVATLLRERHIFEYIDTERYPEVDLYRINMRYFNSRFSEDGCKYTLSKFEIETGLFHEDTSDEIKNELLLDGYCYDTNDDDIIWIACNNNHTNKNEFSHHIAGCLLLNNDNKI
jgi:hypothetical protein